MESTLQSLIKIFASTPFSEEHCTGVLCETQLAKATIEKAVKDCFGSRSVCIIAELFSNFDFEAWDSVDVIIGEYDYGPKGQLRFRYDFFFRRVSNAPEKCLEFLWNLILTNHTFLVIENVFDPNPVSDIILSADKVQEVFLADEECGDFNVDSLGVIYWPTESG